MTNAEGRIVVADAPIRKSREVALAEGAGPLQMAITALRQGVTAEQLKDIMDLQERWEANNARKAYVGAMAEFKRNPPIILKNKHVKFQTTKGITEYDHATLDQVCAAVIDGLSAVQISHRWDLEQANGKIKVTCVLTHVDGHSERTALESIADESGGKNGIQAIGSAVTYLQRYTLLSACGLATKDDDDGAGTGREALSTEQVQQLRAKLQEAGSDEVAFLEYIQAESIESIRAGAFDTVMSIVDSVRARRTARPDLSGGDSVKVNEYVSRIADILAQDKDENAVAAEVGDVGQEVNDSSPELYGAVCDRLAHERILTKAQFLKCVAAAKANKGSGKR